MTTCRHCERVIVRTADGWAQTGELNFIELWRLVCDSNDSFTAEHEPKLDPVRFALSVITDSYLLLAIRNRDTSPIARAMPGSSWSEKDTAMRDEAKRRNLL